MSDRWWCGANDHVFGLCHLLGYRFAPRLRDIRDRRLGTIQPGRECKDLEPLLGLLFRVDLIRECWDDIVRLAASIRAGTVAPSVMLKKLSGYRRQNRLQLASGDRPDRANAFHHGFAEKSRATPALSGWPQ